MKLYFLLVMFCGVATLTALHLLNLSWVLSLMGGVCAASGMTILLLGCSLHRLLSDRQTEDES